MSEQTGPEDLPVPRLTTKIGIDTEELTGRTFPYQFDRALVEDVDLIAATPGAEPPPSRSRSPTPARHPWWCRLPR